jgi:hypothetical protein
MTTPHIPLISNFKVDRTYIDDISMVQSATTSEDGIFQLRVRSEKQTECSRALHIRYSP